MGTKDDIVFFSLNLGGLSAPFSLLFPFASLLANRLRTIFPTISNLSPTYTLTSKALVVIQLPVCLLGMSLNYIRALLFSSSKSDTLKVATSKEEQKYWKDRKV